MEDYPLRSLRGEFVGWLPGRVKTLFVGGTGMYEVPGLEVYDEVEVKTPYGDPSGAFTICCFGDEELVAFLPRHRKGHKLAPLEVPHEANAFAAKTLGVERVVLISACGAMEDGWEAGQFALVDYLWNMSGRTCSLFKGQGVVAHFLEEGFRCEAQTLEIKAALEDVGATVRPHCRAVSIPHHFANSWVSGMYRQDGAQAIGMPSAAEIMTYVEAEMCVTLLIHFTDGNGEEEGFSVDAIKKQGAKNVGVILKALPGMVERLIALPRDCRCGNRLDLAMQTDQSAITAEEAHTLWPLLRRWAKAHGRSTPESFALEGKKAIIPPWAPDMG